MDCPIQIHKMKDGGMEGHTEETGMSDRQLVYRQRDGQIKTNEDKKTEGKDKKLRKNYRKNYRERQTDLGKGQLIFRCMVSRIPMDIFVSQRAKPGIT